MWYREMIGMWEKDWDKKGVVKSKEKLGYWDEKKNREYLPLIPPITLKHSFDFDFDNSSFQISALA